MKVRPILILLLFVGAVGVLCWMYYAVTRPAIRLHAPHVKTEVADLDDCCRRNHVQSVQYEHFAQIAEGEALPTVALLFRAMAHSERVQEQHGAFVIEKLGGRYRPPQRIVLFRGTTAGNIARSIDYVIRHSDSLQYRRIDHHLRYGNRMVARALIWSAAVDLNHRMLLEAHRDRHALVSTHYLVCPRCGHVATTSAYAPFCPFCLTDSRHFVHF